MTGTVPDIGLGTSRNEDPQGCAETVRAALEMGYRHVDTAQRYYNEEYVGDGLARSDIPREEIFLATKVSEKKLAYDDVLSTTEESLQKLGVDYVDLLYMHWPRVTYDPDETLPAFDRLKDEGAIRHVGVSNFTAEVLDEAREVLDAPIVANQVEIHPMLPPDEELVEYCGTHDVDLVAYSPLGRGEALELPEVRAVAEKHGVSAARVILAWLLGQGIKVIPKSIGVDHLRDNLEARTLELDPEDVALIDSIERRKRKFDHDDAPWYR